jgi:hypothetical protein
VHNSALFWYIPLWDAGLKPSTQVTFSHRFKPLQALLCTSRHPHATRRSQGRVAQKSSDCGVSNAVLVGELSQSPSVGLSLTGLRELVVNEGRASGGYACTLQVTAEGLDVDV